MSDGPCKIPDWPEVRKQLHPQEYIVELEAAVERLTRARDSAQVAALSGVAILGKKISEVEKERDTIAERHAHTERDACMWAERCQVAEARLARALEGAAKIADLFFEEYCAKRDDACRADNGDAAITFARQAQACAEIVARIRALADSGARW